MRRFAIYILALFMFFAGLNVNLYAEKIDKIIAIINEDIITEDELDMFAKLTAPQEASMLSKEDFDELKNILLNRMIEDRLILQEAKRQMIKPDPKAVEGRIEEIKVKAGSEKAFQEALVAEGMSLNELREKLTNQLMMLLAINSNVKGKVKVSPKEVTDFFLENKEKFKEPEKVLVDSIFVNDKETLDKAQLELKEGKDFNKVAEKYSQKSSITEIRRSELKKDLENFVFSIKAGERSEPFAIDDGYYIFYVKEFIQPLSLTLDQAKDAITSILENQKMQSLFKEWVETLKDKAYISIRQ